MFSPREAGSIGATVGQALRADKALGTRALALSETPEMLLSAAFADWRTAAIALHEGRRRDDAVGGGRAGCEAEAGHQLPAELEVGSSVEQGPNTIAGPASGILLGHR